MYAINCRPKTVDFSNQPVPASGGMAYCASQRVMRFERLRIVLTWIHRRAAPDQH